jgi:hypothetical protein
VLNLQHRAEIDSNLPGIVVVAADSNPSAPANEVSQRPVYIWNRLAYAENVVRADVGLPLDDNYFPPLDLLFRAPIDASDDLYMQVVSVGTISGYNYVKVRGAHLHDLPQRGSLRILGNGANANKIWKFSNKLAFPDVSTPPTYGSYDLVTLVAPLNANVAYPGAVGEVVELLHDDYSAPCVRVEYVQGPSGEVTLQFKVGILAMDKEYELNTASIFDDFVRGLADGYTVSQIYTQDSRFNGAGSAPTVNVTDFIAYDGGLQPTEGEVFWRW